MSRLLHNRHICYSFKAITGLLNSEQRQKPTRGVEKGEPSLQMLGSFSTSISSTLFCANSLRIWHRRTDAHSPTSGCLPHIWWFDFISLFIFCPCHCGVVAWMHMLPPTHEMRLYHQHTHRGRMLSFILPFYRSFLPHYLPDVEPENFNMTKNSFIFSIPYIHPFSAYISLPASAFESFFSRSEFSFNLWFMHSNT